MLLNSVILVLREVLEAAVLVSVLVAFSLYLRLGARWLLWSLPAAALGTFLFASTLEVITDALDGAGQEVANAALQFAVYALVLCIVVVASRAGPGRWLPPLMALAVACAVTREGAEIMIYVTGFAAAEDQRTAVFAGSALGAGIGISLGILMFSGLRAMAPARCYICCLALLGLIGAGMVMQATMLLEQVDWLPSAQPLWDSSALVSEQAVTGELLYAVFGYEATPSAVQIGLYVGSLLLMAGSWYIAGRSRTGESNG